MPGLSFKQKSPRRAYLWGLKEQYLRIVSQPRNSSVLLDCLRGLQVATEALAQWYGHTAFKYSDKIVVFINNQPTKKGVKHAGT